MGRGYSFRNRNEAHALRDLARERLHSPKSGVQSFAEVDFTKNFYVATPVLKITAATAVRTEDGSPPKMQLGTGMAYLFRRKQRTTGYSFKDNNDGDISYLEYEKVMTSDGSAQQSIRVYNPFMHEIINGGETSIVAPSDVNQITFNNTLIYLQQDVYGDYYVVGELDQPLVPATINSALTAGGYAPATMLTRSVGGSPVFSSISRVVRVYDAMMNTGDSIPNGTKMWIKKIFGRWYMVIPICSTSNTAIPPPVSPPPPATPAPPSGTPPGPLPPDTNYPMGISTSILFDQPNPPTPPQLLAPCTYYSVETSPGVFAWSLNPLAGPCSGCTPPAPPPTGLDQSTTTSCGGGGEEP